MMPGITLSTSDPYKAVQDALAVAYRMGRMSPAQRAFHYKGLRIGQAFYNALPTALANLLTGGDIQGPLCHLDPYEADSVGPCQTAADAILDHLTTP